MDDFITFRSSRIHYCHWGNGSKILWAFHGYGESAAGFGFLGDAIGAELTLVAIDLPYHGQTEWREGYYFDPGLLPEILRSIAARLPGRSGGWRLLGYSMGGRVALHLLEDMPDVFEQMTLLAPDGLTVNPWYWLATRTWAGNQLFRLTMRRPGWLFLLLRAGHLLRLVNPSIYKFTIQYIDNEPVRQQLYIRWTTMRGFRPDPAAIRALILARQLPVSLIYGRYDRIIRWEREERFRQGIEGICRLTLLPTGHQLLRPKYLPELLREL